MTHFTVMVVGENVESILEPYDENLEVDPYIYREPWEIHREFIRYQGKVIATNAPVSNLEKFDLLTLSLKAETVDWIKQWCGKDIDKDGNVLSTYNPNSKWDFYQIGGRWAGTFILKSGKTGVLGERSWCNEKAVIPKNAVDQARKGSIDWEAMNKIAREQAEKDWDSIINPNPDTCWFKPEYVEKLRKIHLKMYGTKENYLNVRGIWTPYAYVDENGWNAPGEMGWFGCSTDETEDRDRYDREFAKYMTNLPSDTLLTMVDCHI